MKKRVLTSVVASTVVLGALVFTGCGSSSNGKNEPKTVDKHDDLAYTKPDSAKIFIKAGDGSTVSYDPSDSQGMVVTIGRNTSAGGQTYDEKAAIVHAELNECNGKTTDDDSDGVVCGPKKEGTVTYIFQSDFGALGPADNNPDTPDGGVLLYDALTELKLDNGELKKFVTPNEGDPDANRLKEIFIPANYITLADNLKNASVDQKYEAMRKYLDKVCNMKCLASENGVGNGNNPYFTNGKESGKFTATYVMHFTRGLGEKYLMEQFEKDPASKKDLLEFLAVTFDMEVSRVDGNSSKLKFTVPENAEVKFYAKRAHKKDILEVATKNINLNEVIHESTDDSDNSLTINMARYFDKLISKGDALGVSDFAKEILVENAQNPWPVKIYGSLIEEGADRSFVRNPGKLDAKLFGLPERLGGQAIKFNIVYPGGKYNKLPEEK